MSVCVLMDVCMQCNYLRQISTKGCSKQANCAIGIIVSSSSSRNICSTLQQQQQIENYYQKSNNNNIVFFFGIKYVYVCACIVFFFLHCCMPVLPDKLYEYLARKHATLLIVLFLRREYLSSHVIVCVGIYGMNE